MNPPPPVQPPRPDPNRRPLSSPPAHFYPAEPTPGQRPPGSSAGSPPKPPTATPPRLYVPLERRQSRKRGKTALRLPRFKSGCIVPLLAGLALSLPILLYLFAPGRTNILLLGIDYGEHGIVAYPDFQSVTHSIGVPGSVSASGYQMSPVTVPKKAPAH